MFNLFKRQTPEEIAAQAGIDSTAPYAATKVGVLRRMVERQFFPEYFFGNPTGFISEITDPRGLSNLYCTALKEQRVGRMPYYDDQFVADTDKVDEDEYLVIAELPEPEYVGLCYRMYFLFDAKFAHIAFYAVERGEDGAQLCELDKGGDGTPICPIATGPWKEKTKEEKDAELQAVKDAFHGIMPGEREPEPAEQEPEPAEQATE